MTLPIHRLLVPVRVWMLACLVLLMSDAHARFSDIEFPTHWPNPVTGQDVAIPTGWYEYGLYTQDDSVTFGDDYGKKAIALSFEPAADRALTAHARAFEQEGGERWKKESDWQPVQIGGVPVLNAKATFKASGEAMSLLVWQGSGTLWRIAVSDGGTKAPRWQDYPLVQNIVRSTQRESPVNSDR